MSANRAALERAIARSLFARAFNTAAKAPDDLVASVEAGLRRRALDALGLARRTGDAVLGFDQAKRALAAGKAEALLTASDAADDGREKLSRLADGRFQCGAFTSAELSAAFGKEGVRHAAIKGGAASRRFIREARRLEGFSSAPPAERPG